METSGSQFQSAVVSSPPPVPRCWPVAVESEVPELEAETSRQEVGRDTRAKNILFSDCNLWIIFILSVLSSAHLPFSDVHILVFVVFNHLQTHVSLQLIEQLFQVENQNNRALSECGYVVKTIRLNVRFVPRSATVKRFITDREQRLNLFYCNYRTSLLQMKHHGILLKCPLIPLGGILRVIHVVGMNKNKLGLIEPVLFIQIEISKYP